MMERSRSSGVQVCLVGVVLALSLSLSGSAVGGSELEAQSVPTDVVLLSEESQDCLGCHGEPDLEAVTEAGKGFNLHVEPSAIMGSVHESLDCVDCHAGADDDERSHYDGTYRTSISCGMCHADVQSDYETTCVHGKAFKAKNPNAPNCHDCHGSHKILPLSSKESVLSPMNQPETCGRCHGSEKLNAAESITKRRLIERYYSSVHWQNIQEGKPAASCSDCHGSHVILPSSNVKSNLNRVGLFATCSQCHSSVVKIYIKGSHGRSLLHGNLDVPTCTTCHGDHDIISLKTQAGGKRDYAATQVCIWCHGNERMMQRYALDTSPVDSYMKDFHGLTQRGSFGTSATCADCHDAHHSLPSSHPESRMHLTNRGTACGRCHGQSNENFIMSFTHKTFTPETGGNIAKTIQLLYIILIVVTIGGMLIHNIIVWSHSFRRKLKHQKKHGDIVRLNSFERAWHWVLLLTFFALVVTGFTLKFPESFLFRWLYSFGLNETIRAWLHRTNAVIMTVNLLIFFLYQLVSRRGKRWFFGMLPTRSDFSEFFATMRYYLNLQKKRPRYNIFNYAAKAEYWGLIWGSIIMLLTGLILWFPKFLPAFSPGWLIEVARIIHFYEAILATLSILVWHFFHVIWHPAHYPMDMTWLIGVMTKEEAEETFTPEAIEAQMARHDDDDDDDQDEDESDT